MGDYAQALRSLDAAAVLTGGVLPAEWAGAARVLAVRATRWGRRVKRSSLAPAR